jgi:hypothetical protein
MNKTDLEVSLLKAIIVFIKHGLDLETITEELELSSDFVNKFNLEKIYKVWW